MLQTQTLRQARPHGAARLALTAVHAGPDILCFLYHYDLFSFDALSRCCTVHYQVWHDLHGQVNGEGKVHPTAASLQYTNMGLYQKLVPGAPLLEGCKQFI